MYRSFDKLHLILGRLLTIRDGATGILYPETYTTAPWEDVVALTAFVSLDSASCKSEAIWVSDSSSSEASSTAGAAVFGTATIAAM